MSDDQTFKDVTVGDPNYDCGLTPKYQRLAAQFVDRGVGRHQAECLDTLGYDYVEVKVNNEWRQYTTPDGDKIRQKEYRVEFYKDTKCTKWIDFTMYMSGGGGRPAFSLHENEGSSRMEKPRSPYEMDGPDYDGSD